MTSRSAPPVAPPVVIYGAPRSGTTYATELLNAHPKVHITDETRLFTWAHLTLSSLDNPQIALTHRAQFRDFLKPRLATLIRGFYSELEPGAYVWGDKNPHYAAPPAYAVLETIGDIFPGARFIHVIRDGREVVTSLVRMRGPSGDPWASFERAHEIWNSHVETGHVFAARAGANAALELRYEELVADDLAMARRLCEFVGIDMDPRVIAFCEQQRERRIPVSRPTRDLTEGAERSEWERVMSESGRRAESLDLLRENLVRFGYEP